MPSIVVLACGSTVLMNRGLHEVLKAAEDRRKFAILEDKAVGRLQLVGVQRYLRQFLCNTGAVLITMGGNYELMWVIHRLHHDVIHHHASYRVVVFTPLSLPELQQQLPSSDQLPSVEACAGIWAKPHLEVL